MCMLSFLLKLISKYLRFYLDNKFALDFAAAVDIVLLEKKWSPKFSMKSTRNSLLCYRLLVKACAIHNPICI